MGLGFNRQKARDGWQNKIDTTALQIVQDGFPEYIRKKFQSLPLFLQTRTGKAVLEKRIVPHASVFLHSGRLKTGWAGLPHIVPLGKSGMWLVQNLNGQVLIMTEVETRWPADRRVQTTKQPFPNTLFRRPQTLKAV